MPDQWTYEKPTEPGWYMVNYGDIVTKDNLTFERFSISYTGLLVDIEGTASCDYGSSYKFIKVDIKALNQVGNG